MNGGDAQLVSRPGIEPIKRHIKQSFIKKSFGKSERQYVDDALHCCTRDAKD